MNIQSKIEAVKLIRARTPMGLSASKQALEAYILTHPFATIDAAVAAIVEANPWRPAQDDTEPRAQLAACHEAIGAALALLRQDQVSAAMLVLDDALKGRTR